MKVLMFGWEFPPFMSGGLGTACQGITRGLAAHDVQVSFVLPSKQKKEIENQDGTRFIAADEVVMTRRFEEVLNDSETIDALRSRGGFTIAPYFTSAFVDEILETYLKHKRTVSGTTFTSLLNFTGNYGKNLMREVTEYAMVGRYLGATEDFDIIHAHDWLTYLAGVAAKEASGKKLVLHMHATEFDRSGENINQEIYGIERFGLEQADHIMAVSHYTRQLLIERYGLPPGKISVVHNAVDKDHRTGQLGLKRNLKEKLVLFLGRVTMQKGPDYFVEAANLVLKKNRNIRFAMAGSGDLLPTMITRAAELRITDRFHFLGFLNRREVEKMYALSDVYVMPSVSEPFGITPFEALLYDVPIIISKRSGVAEVLKDAVLIDFWDVEKLAEKILDMIEKPELAAAVVEKCQHDLKSIEWSTAAGRIRGIYTSVMSGAELEVQP